MTISLCKDKQVQKQYKHKADKSEAMTDGKYTLQWFLRKCYQYTHV